MSHQCGNSIVDIFISFTAFAGNNQPPVKKTTRVFISCYWFFIITVLAIYSGNLVAFTATKRLKFPIENLEQLAENPDYQAGVIARSSTSALFQVQSFSFVRKMKRYALWVER